MYLPAQILFQFFFLTFPDKIHLPVEFTSERSQADIIIMYCKQVENIAGEQKDAKYIGQCLS